MAENYATKFIVDDEGVWAYSGIFPWNKGRYGLNWRDISGATYKTGFLSWLLRSYEITIKHRYTMDNHLISPSVHSGNKMVELVNSIVSEKDLY